MSIHVQCESCGVRRRVNERLAGRTIRCPGCDQPLTIPAGAEPESAAQHAEPVEVEAVEVEAEVVKAEVVEAEAVEADVVGVEAFAAEVVGAHATPRSTAAAGGTALLAEPARTTSPAAEVHHAAHAPSAFIGDDDDALPPRKKRDDGELDMTPMVDVTFLLLIFFMVTASFSLQKSIKMPKQNSDLPSMSQDEEESEDLDPIELEIDENGSFLVLTPEGENETPGKHNLINALKAAIGANKDSMRLDIKVHENAKLQMLVDGMDAATIAGFSEIQVAEVDGFD